MINLIGNAQHKRTYGAIQYFRIEVDVETASVTNFFVTTKKLLPVNLDLDKASQ